MKEIRILPIAILAAGALLGLKSVAFISDGGSGGIALAQEQQAPAEAPAGDELSAAEELFGAGRSESREQVLESLAERRQSLEGRERELDLREGLLRSAEQRIEARVAELKAIEARIGAAVKAEEEADAERFAALVTMYESMKAKDAARIFNGLEMPVLVRVASQIKARSMAEILAEMDSEVAQRLTIALSVEREDPMKRLEEAAADEPGGELPKIVGTRPAG